jgi:hypothetical protein
MEKRIGLRSFFLLGVLCIIIVSNNFISAQLLNTSISNNTGQENVYQLYNITVNNTNASMGINFTQINITVPYFFNITYPINTTVSNYSFSNTSTTFSWTNTSAGGLINNGSLGYFWLNAFVNFTGTYNITVTTLDTSGNSNSTNIPIIINDTIPPFVSFISFTDGLNTSVINYTYIQANVTSNDSGSGINNTVIYLWNSTGLISYTSTNTAGYNFVNFTAGLTNGTYYLNATATDLANNSNSTPTLKIIMNTTVVIPCTPDWVCLGWGSCVNNIETCTSINDSDSCGISFNGTYPTQTCTCTPDWSCTTSPVICSNGTQIRTCTDLNGCLQPDIQDQSCVVGNPVANTSSQQSQVAKTSSSSSSSSPSLFYFILGFIILVAIIVILVLAKLKKKSYAEDDYSSDNKNSLYKTYPPPTGPPAGNISGYPSPSPNYQTY